MKNIIINLGTEGRMEANVNKGQLNEIKSLLANFSNGSIEFNGSVYEGNVWFHKNYDDVSKPRVSFEFLEKKVKSIIKLTNELNLRLNC